MPSTYTLNNGIELIATGEQSGTWGDTTNVNLGLIDTALDGQVTITLAAAGTSGSPNTLPISDGSASNGRNRLVIFDDGGDLGATAFVQLTPNDAEKIVYIRNNLTGGRALTLFQGTYNASNDYEVPAGTTAVVFFNGGGAGAVAANVFNNAFFDSLRLGAVSVTAILDEDNMASDSATALATQQSIKAYVDAQVGANNELSEVLANGNTSGGNDIQMTTTDEVQFRDTALKISSSVDGQLDIAADVELEIVAPTLDINASTAVTIDTTTLTMTGSVNVVGDLDVDNLNINGNSIISTNTDGNIALTPNGTGEVDITKVDIDGGTIDGTVIGGSTPAAISGTTITGTSFVSSGDMTFGDNDKAIFGAGSDLQIYHDGAASFIDEVGTGPLKIRTESFVGIYNGDESETIATFADDGAVRLYYDNAEKLATTATGIDVTGTVTADGLLVQNDGGTKQVVIANGTAGSLASPQFADVLFTGTVGRDKARIRGVDENSSAVGGRLFFETSDANTTDQSSLKTRIVIGRDGNITFLDTSGNASFVYDESAGSTFNEQGADRDFRVESDTDTHAFFVDASANAVGVGTSSPNNKAQVSYTSVAAVPSAGAGGHGFAVGDSGFGIAAGALTSGNGYLQATRWDGSATNYNLILQPNGGSVGIGTSSPTAKLTAAGLSGTTLIQALGADSNGFADIEVKSTGSSGASRLYFSDTAAQSGLIRYSHSTDTMGFTTAGSEHTSISSTGLLTNQIGAVFNESGADSDFRVESDTNTHMLFVDASANAVGIGLSNPGVALHVKGPTDGNVMIVDATGTSANYIFDVRDDGTSVFRVDPLGNVGIGSTSPIGSLTVQRASAASSLSLRHVASGNGYGYLVATTGTTTNDLIISSEFNGSPTERMRIDASGTLIHKLAATFNEDGADADFRVESDSQTHALFVDAGTNSVGIADSAPGATKTFTDTTIATNFFVNSNVATNGPMFQYDKAGVFLGLQNDVGSGTRFFISFGEAGTRFGDITSNGSVMTYGGTSDYRLKTNVQPMTGAIDRVKALNPVTFDWISSGISSEGFIAHELQSVIPDAATGTKDEVNAQGKPVYQQIDPRHVVSVLTAALQEAIAKIETLEARIAALETA